MTYSAPTGNVDACVEELDSTAMPEDVGGWLLGGDGGTGPGGSGGVSGNDAADGVAAERRSSGAGEQRIIRLAWAFVHPGAEHLGGLGSERCGTLFSALAGAGEVGASSKHDMCSTQAGELGDS
jgi:hypothetical protein